MRETQSENYERAPIWSPRTKPIDQDHFILILLVQFLRNEIQSCATSPMKSIEKTWQKKNQASTENQIRRIKGYNRNHWQSEFRRRRQSWRPPNEAWRLIAWRITNSARDLWCRKPELRKKDVDVGDDKLKKVHGFGERDPVYGVTRPLLLAETLRSGFPSLFSLAPLFLDSQSHLSTPHFPVSLICSCLWFCFLETDERTFKDSILSTNVLSFNPPPRTEKVGGVIRILVSSAEKASDDPLSEYEDVSSEEGEVQKAAGAC